MKYCKDLQKGGLIGVAFSKYIHLAIYKGLGSRGNPNFWYIDQVLSSKFSTSGGSIYKLY